MKKNKAQLIIFLYLMAFSFNCIGMEKKEITLTQEESRPSKRIRLHEKLPELWNRNLRKHSDKETDKEDKESTLHFAAFPNTTHKITTIKKTYLASPGLLNALKRKRTESGASIIYNSLTLTDLQQQKIDISKSVPIRGSKNSSFIPYKKWLLEEIFKATVKGNLSRIQELIKTSHPFLEKNDLLRSLRIEKNGDSLLHLAARNGYAEIVKFLHQRGIPINQENIAGSTPLHFACYCLSMPVVRYLIKNGANINYKNNLQAPPLFVLLLNKNNLPEKKLEMLKWLTEAYKANLLIRRNNQQTLLHIAATQTPEIGGYLINKGLNVNACDEKYQTPLHDATSPEIVRLLINNGANKNARNIINNTPLHTAVLTNKEMVARCLIDEFNVDHFARGDGQRTLLHMAAITSPEFVHYLIKKGLDVNACDACGQTPLHYASNPETVRLLMGNGGKIMRNQSNNTPLGTAVGKNLLDVLKCLIEEGHADCSMREGQNQETLLDAAAQAGSISIAHYLLSKGISINALSSTNTTPLFYATTPEMAEFLIKNGAKQNHENKTGLEAFHRAIVNNRADVVKFFVEKKLVDLQKYKYGSIGLSFANRLKHTSIAQYLISKGAKRLN